MVPCISVPKAASCLWSVIHPYYPCYVTLTSGSLESRPWDTYLSAKNLRVMWFPHCGGRKSRVRWGGEETAVCVMEGVLTHSGSCEPLWVRKLVVCSLPSLRAWALPWGVLILQNVQNPCIQTKHARWPNGCFGQRDVGSWGRPHCPRCQSLWM